MGQLAANGGNGNGKGSSKLPATIYSSAIENGGNLCIGYTPRARLLSDLATKCRRHEVAKSLGNQARGVQPACTMTTQNSKIRLISSIALKSRLITYLTT